MAFALVLFFAVPAFAQAVGAPIPGVPNRVPAPNAIDFKNVMNSVDMRAPLQAPGLSTPLQLIFLMASLTLLPFLFIATTSFIRTVVVLTFFKAALGSQSLIP